MSESKLAGLEGDSRLRRLETFLDVAYAVLFVQFLQYLPAMEDMKWLEMPNGLFTLLVDHVGDVLRLVVALTLTMLMWAFTHKLLGPLARSDGKHTILVLVQLALVCMFLYFAIADPELVSVSSPLGQSLCLAASGFVGVSGWDYARKHGLMRDGIEASELDAQGRRIWIEPVTAFLNAPVALLGPIAWTLGWILIPLSILGVMRLARRGRA